MGTRVSKPKVETQGRGNSSVNSDLQVVADRSQAPHSYAEAYEAILAKELLINDNQEEYTKYF
jgi:hypothetical protein